MTMKDDRLNHMMDLTRDYGRMLNRSTGLCSLWTGFCLAGLTVITLAWSWQHFLALGRPKGHYLLYMLSTQDSLPRGILVLAFLLPFLWAPGIRALGGWVYPERFGIVRTQSPEWLKGLEPLAGPLNRWFPLAILSLLALAFGIGLPLFGRVLGNPPEMNVFLWRAFLAPLLGGLWAWLLPTLRKAEAAEGVVLVYVAGFLLAGRNLSMVLIAFPLYVLMTLAIMAYGLWAHARYRRAMVELEALAPEAADV